MNVRLTIWRSDDIPHSHIYEFDEAMKRGDAAARKPGFTKYTIQPESVTVDEAISGAQQV